ncbi:hypothetical protein [Rhodoferax sp. TH121]|uniref:hypothetical protein n=1 Tax=Rhodoferax sp. TH121 TaxID=2022803 RepID=UPI001595AB69|nr:hypothetical protein [Rhodoferax sp. TH121]
MLWTTRHIKGIMLLSGVLTCTMLYAAIAPQAALSSQFGSSLQGPVAEVVVRSWAVLITLVGGMLLYGAYHPAQRPLVLAVAGTSKLAFVSLVLTQGGALLQHQAGIAVAVDSLFVLLYAGYFAGRANQVKLANVASSRST